MNGRTDRPSQRYLDLNYPAGSWFSPFTYTQCAIYSSMLKPDKAKIKRVAQYYDWYYDEYWSKEVSGRRDRRRYITKVLGKFILLGWCASRKWSDEERVENVGLLTAPTIRALEEGPSTPMHYVDVLFRAYSLPVDEREEVIAQYEESMMGQPQDDT